MQSKNVVVQVWPIDRLRPYARNLRKNDHAVDQMVAAIKEFGFKIPLLVRSDGELIDGHLRLKAAQKLGFTELPVILCDEWTPEQVRAFRLSVNRSASWATWDLEGVSFELASLKLSGFNLGLTGFSGFEIDSFLSRANKVSADSVSEVPHHPVSRPVICGCAEPIGCFVEMRRRRLTLAPCSEPIYPI